MKLESGAESLRQLHRSDELLHPLTNKIVKDRGRPPSNHSTHCGLRPIAVRSIDRTVHTQLFAENASSGVVVDHEGIARSSARFYYWSDAVVGSLRNLHK